MSCSSSPGAIASLAASGSANRFASYQALGRAGAPRYTSAASLAAQSVPAHFPGQFGASGAYGNATANGSCYNRSAQAGGPGLGGPSYANMLFDAARPYQQAISGPGACSSCRPGRSLNRYDAPDGPRVRAPPCGPMRTFGYDGLPRASATALAGGAPLATSYAQYHYY